MPIEPAAAESVQALLLGLAFSGLIATAWECATARRASFALVGKAGPGALAALPVLLAAAPFIILRGALSVRRFERRRPMPVMAATIIAGLWGLASGRMMLMLAHQIAA